MKYGSVCSGIEAATVAWHPLGWKPAWFAEIEAFPSQLLAHHYPSVPNLGDLTLIAKEILAGRVVAPECLVGGTPCQAFSFAGLRESLADARGNLSLKFVELADAIDHVRIARGDAPAVIVWENVPGVLSTSDNAFGCFLGALSGADCELQPAGKRWSDAGCVYGPQRAVAWRILDAQFFGLAQRRRRVFVVASARAGFDPASVLLESDGVRRDHPPRREPGENAAVCPTLRAGGNSTGGDRPPGTDVDTADSLICVATGQASAGIVRDMAPTLNCNHEAPYIAHTLRGEGFDASEDGTGRGTPLVPVAFVQNHRDEVRLFGGDGATVGALAAEPGAKQQCYVAFSCKDHGADAGELAPTLRAMGHGASHANAGGQVAVAFQSSQSGVRTGTVHATLDSNNGSRRHNGVITASAVRRLTPRECERLQGFPDDYTLIPVRGKPAADGPRYKALGNSMAVPVMRWIGQRIDKVLARRVAA